MPESSNARACALVAAISVLLVFSWTAARIHYAFNGNWTALFCAGTAFPVPPDLGAGTYRFDGGGYDGQFYRYLAHDPFLRKGYSRYMDAPQLRSRRILVPLLAWLLALGRSRWIDGAYVAIEMLFLAMGCYWCARLLARRGQSPYWGLLFAVVPASLASFDRMLIDGPLTALFAGFLLYCEEERWTPILILATLAALTRETGLLLGGALVADRLLHGDRRRAGWFALSGAPAAAWYAYLAIRLPHDGPLSILAFPDWGFLRRLLWLRPYPDPRVQWILRITDILAVLGLVASIILAARWLRDRRPDPVTFCVGAFAVLALVLGSPSHMTEAMGFARPVSPLLLYVMVEAVSRKAWIALSAPLFLSLSESLAFANPLAAIARGLAGR